MASRSVIALLVGGVITILFGLIGGVFTQITSIIGAASLLFALLRFYSDRDKEKRRQQDIVEQSIKPAISPLVTQLKTASIGDVSIEQIAELEKKAEHNVRSDADLIPTILEVAYEFARHLKIEEKYRKSYGLAIAYRLVLSKDIKEGQTAREINSAVTKRNVIRCGKELWNLSKEEVDWYVRFSESDDLLDQPFQQIYNNAKNFDSIKIEKERDEIHNEAQGLRKYLKEKDERFQRLMTLIMKKMSPPDFLKIMVSLRTDIVLISLQGVSDPGDRGGAGSIETGSKYIKTVLQEFKLNFGKLNRSVYFAFLKDIVPKGTDPRYFDLQSWGKQIEKRAYELRENEHAKERKFNFVVLKSSLHELRSFGDKLEDESRIKISAEMLTNIGSDDANISTLVTISKILRESQSTSLHDFINKNLQYVNGISDESNARKIAEGLAKKYDKNDWLVSDFKNCNVKKEDLIELGYSEDQAIKIIEESKSIAELILA